MSYCSLIFLNDSNVPEKESSPAFIFYWSMFNIIKTTAMCDNAYKHSKKQEEHECEMFPGQVCCDSK